MQTINGRKPVTAEELYNMPDGVGYLFSKEKEEFGLDPWTIVTGTDKLHNGSIILEYGSYFEKEVSPETIVFV